MENIPKILIYRHDDPDGLWSAAVVKSMYDHQASYARKLDLLVQYDIIDVPVNYNKNTWNEEDIKNAIAVYVLDFTFDDMDMFYRVAGEKAVWIDHHKTAMEKFTELWNNEEFKGLRSLEHAGCKLTWKYINPALYTPDSIDYIADRDMWEFKYENTKPFCEAAFVKIKSIFDKDVSILIDPYKNSKQELLNEYIEFGQARLDEQKLRVENAFNRGFDFTFNGHRARLVNCTSDISEIGQYIYLKDEYDIAVMWYVDDDRIKVSLRSNTVDCAEIGQKYGGGGHRGASGFSINNKDIVDFMGLE